MKLSELSLPPGATKKRKIVGRGRGSGHGGSSTRGMKGQKSRSGGGVRPGFEGGQMPLMRRIPKRGFDHSKFKIPYAVVNLDMIEKKFQAGSEVNPEVLRKAGLVKGKDKLIKVLGDGKLTKPLSIKAHAFSSTARERITSSGGNAEVLPC